MNMNTLAALHPFVGLLSVGTPFVLFFSTYLKISFPFVCLAYCHENLIPKKFMGTYPTLKQIYISYFKTIFHISMQIA